MPRTSSRVKQPCRRSQHCKSGPLKVESDAPPLPFAEWLLARQVATRGFGGHPICLRAFTAATRRGPAGVVVYLAGTRGGTSMPSLAPAVAADRCMPVVATVAAAKKLPAPVSAANAVAYHQWLPSSAA
jgi:hypothetical protein